MSRTSGQSAPLPRLKKDEAGAVAIIVALFLVVLLIIGALVLDLGSLYGHDRELQSAADAAALAGAQELVYSKGSIPAAKGAATGYVTLNAAQTSVDETNLSWPNGGPVVDSRSVTVDLREDEIPFSFARVIGRTSGSATAHAKAELMYLTALNGLFPVAIPYLHPDHFDIVYGSGTGAISYEVRDSLDGKDNDLGMYDDGGYNGPLTLAPGLHSVTLHAENDADQDLTEPWTEVGSLFVPQSTVNLTKADRSRIRRVNVTRTITVPSDPLDQLSESVAIRLRTSAVTESTVDVEITVEGKKAGSGTVTLNWTSSIETDRVYTGSITISASSFDGVYGEALVTITSAAGNNSSFPDGVPLAYYKIFQSGGSIVYMDQGPDPWDNYSAAGASALMNARVQTKIYNKFNTQTVLKPSQKRLMSFVSADGWADIWTNANLEDEILLALGSIQPKAGWQLTPDVEGPFANHDGNADIGEWVPIKTGLRVGQWKKALDEAVGKTVAVALITPDPEAFKHDSMVIQSFAAFKITQVVIQGNTVDIAGEWVHKLDTGEWSHENPNPGGLYVETAVLTE